MNREEWLSRAVEKLTPLVPLDEMPPVRVSVGWASRSPAKSIGECWALGGTDGVPQIFISPLLSATVASLGNPNGVLETLLHEMIHAALPPKTGHGPKFKKACNECGLLPPYTATTASPELVDTLTRIAAELGPYPHAELVLVAKTKKQTSRWIKVSCPECGYIARTTRQWLEELGGPFCPCGLHEKYDDKGSLKQMEEDGAD